MNFLKAKLDEFMDEITAEPTVAMGLFLDGLARRLAEMARSEEHLKISIALTHELLTKIAPEYLRAKENGS